MTGRLRYKLSPNELCPCGSGLKFKRCCRSKVDWQRIIDSGEDQIRHFSARGKNLYFIYKVFEALQLDTEKEFESLNYKKAFTAKAVRQIYEAVMEVWPPDTDLKSVLSKGSRSVGGIYVGDYQGDFLEQALVRHSLYADRILLVDPFVHPYTIAPEYNPLLNPESYRIQTLKNVNRLYQLLPWIDAGLVEFIRTPDCFDRPLARAVMTRAAQIKADPEIQAALQASADTLSVRHKEKMFWDTHILGMPDDALRSQLRKAKPEKTEQEINDLIDFIQSQRDANPDFLGTLDQFDDGQLFIMSSGGTIEMASAVAEMTGSYLFTDISVRWKLIQRERQKLNVHSRTWSPFAKAMQGADLSFLNTVDLDTALRIRKEDRLEGIRSVLRKAWKANLRDDEFDESNAIELAQNLQDEILAAEGEWTAIQADLLKDTVFKTAAAVGAAGPLIATGHGAWAAGGAIAGALVQMGVNYKKRESFERRFPASFFMDLTDDANALPR